MTDEKETEKNKYIRAGALVRGLVINELSLLEAFMEMFIANHFCPEQPLNNEFIKLMLKHSKMQISTKRKIVTVLLKEMNFEFIDDFHIEIAKIIQYRNIFAHDLLDTSPEGIEKYKNKYVAFVTPYKTDEGGTAWDDEQYNNLINLIRKWIAIFRALTGKALPAQS